MSSARELWWTSGMKKPPSKSSRIRRKCKCCKCFFYPNPRVGARQRYCSNEACRRASKKASQAKWLAKNPGYFRGGDSTERVRAWRRRNPGYWKCNKRAAVSQQDQIKIYPVAPEEDAACSARHAQQEQISALEPVLAGILAFVTGSTQQDEIAQALQKVLSLSREIGRVTVA